MSDLKKKNIIVWDLETSPALTFTWGLFKQNIDHDYVIEPWTILCAAYKKLGSKKVHTISVFDEDNKNKKLDYKDDYLLCKKLREVIANADIIIAHNGNSFDTKMFNTRLVYHGLEPIPPSVMTVDTMREARKILRSPSTSMNYLCRYFGIDEKIHTSKHLWLDIVFPDSPSLARKSAMNKMVKYCAQDIKVNEKLYMKLLPYMKAHPNLADANTHNCPKCNSDNTVRNGIKRNRSGLARQEFKCNGCGSYFSSRLSEREVGKSLSKL